MAKNNSDSFVKIDDRIDAAILEARRIFIFNPIDSATAIETIRKLWYLELSEPGKPILLVINSPGGSIHDGFAIWDQIKMISCPITTLVTGLAASMGSILSLCASPKRRFATPNARIMIHQPAISGAVEGQATDLAIHAAEMLKARNRIIEIYAEQTGQAKETIDRAIDRDSWMNPEEAKKFGLLDGVVTSFDMIPS